MSIASEITRLQTAKADIKAAIENKGVTVPSAATLDEFSDYIDEISGGGGGGIDWDDFVNLTAPESITLDTATVIQKYTFAGTGVQSISSDSVTEIKEYAFCECPNLKSISFPNLTVMRSGTGSNTNSNGNFFINCNSLETLYLPKLQDVYGNLAFAVNNMTKAANPVVLPSIRNLGVRAFRGFKASVIDLGPNLVQILADTFYNAPTPIPILILRGSAVVPAASTDAIRDLRAVYVPSALIESYKTATNWSTRYDAGYITFHAIEGSQYETAYADGTPISA